MADTNNEYHRPVDVSVVEHMVDETSSGSHEGSYKGSIDYAVPVGTDVFAANGGIVTRVRDDSDRYGQDARFGPDVNYITIRHSDNEVSEYLHLAKGSATVTISDKVNTGQKIAETGLSGWMFAPHLHFMVYPDKGEFQCKRIKFVD